MKNAWVIIFLFLATAGFVARGQDASDTPSSPLVAVIESGRYYKLVAKSPSDVTAYRLGCVRSRERRSIMLLFPPKRQRIARDEFFAVIPAHGIASEIATCNYFQSQLTVVEVTTDDGGVWYLDIRGANPELGSARVEGKEDNR